MLPSPTLRIWILAFVALSLLWVRLGGTHLHLCLDDQDARATVHLDRVGHVAAHDPHEAHEHEHAHAPADHHAHGHGHGTEQDPAHTDLDVPLLDELLTKTGKPGQDLPALLLILLAFVMLSPSAAPRLQARHRHRHPPPNFPPRPPSQAPPALAS